MDLNNMLSELNAFLNQTLFRIGDLSVTGGQVVLLPLILIVGVVLTRVIARLLTRSLQRRKTNADLIQLLRRAFYILATLILIFSLLEFLNVPLTAFAFVSGAVAIGVGFGAQNIINNFISGWILMWERPIRIGDFLEVGDAKGTVESIDTRSTRFRRTDGVHMLIPNSFLLENTVVNWTLIDRLMRTTVRVGVAYGSPVREVERLIQLSVDERDDIIKDPAPLVIFEDFGDSALIFDVYFWVHATVDRDLRKIRSSVRFRIDDLFREHGITIAFPQRDVHVDGTLTMARPDPD
jgi:small-conductance mechanosensitive channel